MSKWYRCGKEVKAVPCVWGERPPHANQYQRFTPRVWEQLVVLVDLGIERAVALNDCFNSLLDFLDGQKVFLDSDINRIGMRWLQTPNSKDFDIRFVVVMNMYFGKYWSFNRERWEYTLEINDLFETCLFHKEVMELLKDFRTLSPIEIMRTRIIFDENRSYDPEYCWEWSQLHKDLWGKR